MPSPDDNILIYFTAYSSNHPAQALLPLGRHGLLTVLAKVLLLPYLTLGRKREATGNMFLLQVAGKALNCCPSRKHNEG